MVRLRVGEQAGLCALGSGVLFFLKHAAGRVCVCHMRVCAAAFRVIIGDMGQVWQKGACRGAP